MMSGRVAIVTGAGSGLGLATSDRLAKDAFHVICAGRSGTVDDQTAALCSRGYSAEAIHVDLSRPAEVERLIETVADRHGRIDVLINNAGFGSRRGDLPPSLAELTLDEWNAVLAVNLTAPFLLARAVFPYMQRRGWGRIVNVSSRAGRTGVAAAEAAYSASKAGLLGLTRYLAMSAGSTGITVNAIAAGRFATSQANHIDPAMFAEAVAGIPVGRPGDPMEFAATVGFLVSDSAAYITGATLDVNGGAFMA